MSVAREQLSLIDGIVTETTLKYQELKEQLVELEKEMVDLYHVIEFGTFNAVQGYKLAKRVKETRQRRREVKEDVDLLAPIVEKFNTPMLQQADKEIRTKESKLSKQKYEFRALTTEVDGDIIALMKDTRYGYLKNNNRGKRRKQCQ